MREDTLRALTIAREAIENYEQHEKEVSTRETDSSIHHWYHLGRRDGAREAAKLLDAAFDEDDDPE
jgi:hypothetical protein